MNRTIVALSVLALATPAFADDWPQWMGPKRDGVWRETGIIDKFPEGGPKVLWRVPIHGGYTGPAVTAGKVYVMDYAPEGGKPVQSATSKPVKGKERVLCLDAKTGKELWKHEYDCDYKLDYAFGPRCTPTVDGDRVYTVGSMGNLYCLEANTGKVVWSKDFVKDYMAKIPIWGSCGHPLVDGDKLFCLAGGPDAVAVAFDKKTGKELWKAVDASLPGYCPPTMIEAGGTRQLLIWDGDKINSLDPENGKVYWTVPLKPSFGMSIMAPRQEGDHLFAAGNGNVAVLLKLASDKPAATEVWRGEKNTAVYPINMTPFLEAGTIYGVDQPGQLRGVELATGKRLWETTAPTTGAKPIGTGTAFLIKNGDRFFLMSENGDLIIAKLSPKGYDEISRAKLLDPTGKAFGRDVVWSYPAFADKCVFARNDKEIVCVSLAAGQ
jgi:outer membrane protein assembly factor BamB